MSDCRPHRSASTSATVGSNSTRASCSGAAANWWGSWLQTARVKSCGAYGFFRTRGDASPSKEAVESDDASDEDVAMDDIVCVEVNNADSIDEYVDEDDDDSQIEIRHADTNTDANGVDDESGKTLAEKARQKLSSLFGSIAETFAPNRNDYDQKGSSELYVMVDDELVAIERWKALLVCETTARTYR